MEPLNSDQISLISTDITFVVLNILFLNPELIAA
jgi:hypothetical protein